MIFILTPVSVIIILTTRVVLTCVYYVPPLLRCQCWSYVVPQHQHHQYCLGDYGSLPGVPDSDFGDGSGAFWRGRRGVWMTRCHGNDDDGNVGDDVDVTNLYWVLNHGS